MKIVNIVGGLGNQMFQYAMYLVLKDAHPEEEIKVCTRSFNGYGRHNGLQIDLVFGLHINEASLADMIKIAYPIFNYKMWQVMYRCLPKRKSMTLGTSQVSFNFDDITRNDSCYYDGYWQNDSYFKHIRTYILRTFSFPKFNDDLNRTLVRRLVESNSVSVHIRRGDYLQEPILCVCNPGYYNKGIDYLKAKDKLDMLCVFSDDIPWCREHLKSLDGDIEIVYVDWNKGTESYRDMQLMTYCKHNVIANSSFSWWGAWLGRREGKIVVAPKVWYNKPLVNDPICENWVRI